MKRQKDTHHFWWPKRFYKKWGVKNRLIELSFELHHTYHRFFMGKCKESEERKCHNHGYCQYSTLCCYWRSPANWGERVI